MATQEEAIGAGVAAQALAVAAIKMLTRLGHPDLIEEIRSEALKTLAEALEDVSDINRDEANEHGRLTVMGLTEVARVIASRETGSRQ